MHTDGKERPASPYYNWCFDGAKKYQKNLHSN